MAEKLKELASVAILGAALVFAVQVFAHGEQLGLRQASNTDLRDDYFLVEDMEFDRRTNDTRILLNEDRAEVVGGGAYAEGSHVTIVQAGRYVLSGTLNDGTIRVDAGNGKVWLFLDGASITCQDGAAVQVEQAGKVLLVLAEESENLLSCGSEFSTENSEAGIRGAVFSRDDLTIGSFGDGETQGTLSVISNYRHGIVCNDDLVITGGKLDVQAPEDGIHANDSVRFRDMELEIQAGDDGVTVSNDEDSAMIYVLSGEIRIPSCVEGLEAATVLIDGGVILIRSSDDGINADSYGSTALIHIRGGSVTVINQSGRDADGLDSNRDVLIEGGTLFVSVGNDGSSNAVDYGRESGGTFRINGGTVLATGSAGMSEPVDASSTQCSVLYNFSPGASAGTVVTVQTEGMENWTETVENAFNSILISRPEMRVGGVCVLTIGEQREEITLDSVSVNSGVSGGPGGPPPGGPPPGGRGGRGGPLSDGGFPNGFGSGPSGPPPDGGFPEGFGGGPGGPPPDGGFPEGFGGGPGGPPPDGGFPEGFVGGPGGPPPDGGFPNGFVGGPGGPPPDGRFPEGFGGSLSNSEARSFTERAGSTAVLMALFAVDTGSTATERLTTSSPAVPRLLSSTAVNGAVERYSMGEDEAAWLPPSPEDSNAWNPPDTSGNTGNAPARDETSSGQSGQETPSVSERPSAPETPQQLPSEPETLSPSETQSEMMPSSPSGTQNQPETAPSGTQNQPETSPSGTQNQPETPQEETQNQQDTRPATVTPGEQTAPPAAEVAPVPETPEDQIAPVPTEEPSSGTIGSNGGGTQEEETESGSGNSDSTAEQNNTSIRTTDSNAVSNQNTAPARPGTGGGTGNSGTGGSTTSQNNGSTSNRSPNTGTNRNSSNQSIRQDSGQSGQNGGIAGNNSGSTAADADRGTDTSASVVTPKPNTPEPRTPEPVTPEPDTAEPNSQVSGDQNGDASDAEEEKTEVSEEESGQNEEDTPASDGVPSGGSEIAPWPDNPWDWPPQPPPPDPWQTWNPAVEPELTTGSPALPVSATAWMYLVVSAVFLAAGLLVVRKCRD